MRRFIAKAAGVLILTLMVGYGILFAFIKIKPAYFIGSPSNYLFCKYQYSQLAAPSDFRNIVIGDSRGNASIDPNVLGKEWLNLSIPGTGLFEAYLSLKHFTKNNPVDTLIIMYGIEYIEKSSTHFESVSFNFPSAEELNDLDRLEKNISDERNGTSLKPTVRLKAEQLKRRLRYHHFPELYRETFADGLEALSFPAPETKDKMEHLEAKLKLNRGHTNFGEADSNSVNSFTSVNRSFSPDPVNKAYLDSVIRLAAKMKAHTYFIVAPINHSSGETYLHSDYAASVDSFFKKLGEAHPEVTVIQQPVSLPNDKFGDPLHLNPRGTRQYSLRLKRILDRRRNNGTNF